MQTFEPSKGAIRLLRIQTIQRLKGTAAKTFFSAANVQADLVIIRSVILVVGDTSVDKSLLQIVLLCITLSMD